MSKYITTDRQKEIVAKIKKEYDVVRIEVKASYIHNFITMFAINSRVGCIGVADICELGKEPTEQQVDNALKVLEKYIESHNYKEKIKEQYEEIL